MYPEIFIARARAQGFVKNNPNLGRITVSKVRAKNCPGVDHENPWKGKFDPSKGHFGMDRQAIIKEALVIKLGLDWDRNSPPEGW